MGIPAVELDITTGKYVVLLWTSKEAALKYCYVQKPGAEKNLYQLTRRSSKDNTGKTQVIQSGLIRIARSLLLSKMAEVTHFVIDHPGTRGPALYLPVEDVANVGRKRLPETVKTGKDLHRFLDAIDDD